MVVDHGLDNSDLKFLLRRISTALSLAYTLAQVHRPLQVNISQPDHQHVGTRHQDFHLENSFPSDILLDHEFSLVEVLLP